MTRITKELREMMVTNAVRKAGIFDRLEKLAEARHEFAESARVDALGGPAAAAAITALQAQQRALAASVPECVRAGGELINTSNSIYLNIAGMAYRASWIGFRPTPYCHKLMAGHPLVQLFLDIEAQSKALDAEREQLEAQVRAALGSFTTVNKLLAAWPEAAELLPEYSPAKPKATLPAVPVADLNKLIGLPSA